MADSSVPEGITITVEDITPEQAAAWLKRNTKNRRLRRPRVEQLAGALSRGEWTFNGATIAFFESGRLLDGQHRLAAIARSGIPIRSIVVRGLPDKAQETTDTGAKRTSADMLKLRDYPRSASLAATARLLLSYYANRSFAPIPTQWTPRQILDFVEAHSDQLLESVRIGARVASSIGMPATNYAAIHYLATEVDGVDANVFFERLITGVAPEPGEPIYMLRQKILTEGLKTSRRVDPLTVAAWTIKAFNAYRDGVPMRLIKWARGGATRESFPRLNDHPLEQGWEG